MKTLIRFALFAMLALGVTGAARAVPVTVSYQPAGSCDPVAYTGDVDADELGVGFSDPKETISASGLEHISGTFVACDATDMRDAFGFEVSDLEVTITNTTDEDFEDLWFVSDAGDPATGTPVSLTNLDGYINGGEAFRIDADGNNRPLSSESLLADGIFKAGETWIFYVQDWGVGTYSASGPCSINFDDFTSISFGSQGAVGNASCSDNRSGASIVASVSFPSVDAPEPATALLIGLGLAGLGLRGRRRRTA